MAELGEEGERAKDLASVALTSADKAKISLLRIERPAQIMFASMASAAGFRRESGSGRSFHVAPVLEEAGDLLMPDGIRQFASKCG